MKDDIVRALPDQRTREARRASSSNVRAAEAIADGVITRVRAALGYVECDCRDCFEVAVARDNDGPHFCHGCAEAGCEAHAGECKRCDADGEVAS